MIGIMMKINKMADGVYSGALTEEGAKSLMFGAGRRRGGGDDRHGLALDARPELVDALILRHHRAWIDAHGAALPVSGATMSEAEATSASPTRATALNFQMPRMTRRMLASMRN